MSADTTDAIRAILERAQRNARPAEEIERWKADQAAEAERAQLEAKRIPPRYLKPLGGLERDTEALRDAREWTAGTGWGFLLAGDVGGGKTFACCDALRRFDGSGLFVKAEEIASPAGVELLPRARAVRLLVLDELGGEALYDSGAARLLNLLGHRYDFGLRTLVTANLNFSDFAARYTARTLDRFRPGDGGRAKEYGGPSLRAGGR